MTTPPDLPGAAFDACEDTPANQSANPTLGDVIAERLTRRDLIRGALAVSVVTSTIAPLAIASAPTRAQAAPGASPRFAFTEVTAGSDATHHVAEGYNADILIRWGDAVLPDAPAFDPLQPSASAQEKQFGYNNDFIGFIPLDGSRDRGLLVVNHEYTND